MRALTNLPIMAQEGMILTTFRAKMCLTHWTMLCPEGISETKILSAKGQEAVTWSKRSRLMQALEMTIAL